MPFDKKFIARSRVRFQLGAGISGIVISLASLLTFAKVWSDTFAFYGVPALPVYIAFPVVYIIICWLTGLFYEKSGIWEEETSFGNKNLNPEFLKICEDSEKIVKDMQDLKKLITIADDIKEIRAALNLPEKKEL